MTVVRVNFCRCMLAVWLFSSIFCFSGCVGCNFITRQIIKRKTFTYMGCYVDKAQSRDLLIPGGHGNHMDPTECNEVCKKRMKTKFMGLQDGGNCWCGNKFNKYGKAKDSACNTPCAGNPKEKCGGRYLNSVFETA
ncbi:hypothetical protein BOX15_Mlig028933g2 [Macrostomum lignano]|uniref:WSC domain-containing protein n=1 Tax=Macrostomum lignano TaxID=282301 RepID=A0A267EC33_9PLAT|nr:hypothetical protein BOX15_Mlig028933g2 [Macrostomum lignano]